MRSLVFEGNTWSIYEALREQDKVLHKALRKLLKEMLRSDPATGMGKPEQLKHYLSGFWSKRLSHKDRLIFSFDENYCTSTLIYLLKNYTKFSRTTIPKI